MATGYVLILTLTPLLPYHTPRVHLCDLGLVRGLRTWTMKLHLDLPERRMSRTINECFLAHLPRCSGAVWHQLVWRNLFQDHVFHSGVEAKSWVWTTWSWNGQLKIAFILIDVHKLQSDQKKGAMCEWYLLVCSAWFLVSVFRAWRSRVTIGLFDHLNVRSARCCHVSSVTDASVVY